MKLNHIAFWTQDIDRLFAFYQKYFEGQVIFSKEIPNFKCTFIKICSSVVLEIMSVPNLEKRKNKFTVGHSHISLEVDSKGEVDRLTAYFENEGIPFEKKREQYDDGFYESAIIDPDGNIIEFAYLDRSITNF